MENFLVYKAFDQPIILLKNFKVISDLSDWSQLRFAVSKFNEYSKGVGVKSCEKVVELGSFAEAVSALPSDFLCNFDNLSSQFDSKAAKNIFDKQFSDFISETAIDKIVAGVNFVGPMPINFFKETLVHWDKNLNHQRSYIMLLTPELSMVSVTPELLFKKSNLSLKTMSLAGTVMSADREMLFTDPKLVSEQKLVTDALVSDLSNLCVEIDVKEKSLSRFSDIVHAHTPIEAQLKIGVGVSQIIDSLHPSPALGVAPKTKCNLSFLKKQRADAQLSKYFGSPVYMNYESFQYCAVNIRTVYPSSSSLTVPIGCGILKNSNCDQEFQELLNKKDSLYKELGILG